MSDVDQITSPIPEKEKVSVEKMSQQDLKEAEKVKSAGRKKKARKGPKVAVKPNRAPWELKRAEMDRKEIEKKRKRELAREERERKRKRVLARVHKLLKSKKEEKPDWDELEEELRLTREIRCYLK